MKWMGGQRKRNFKSTRLISKSNPKKSFHRFQLVTSEASLSRQYFRSQCDIEKPAKKLETKPPSYVMRTSGDGNSKDLLYLLDDVIDPDIDLEIHPTDGLDVTGEIIDIESPASKLSKLGKSHNNIDFTPQKYQIPREKKEQQSTSDIVFINDNVIVNENNIPIKNSSILESIEAASIVTGAFENPYSSLQFSPADASVSQLNAKDFKNKIDAIADIMQYIYFGSNCIFSRGNGQKSPIKKQEQQYEYLYNDTNIGIYMETMMHVVGFDALKYLPFETIRLILKYAFELYVNRRFSSKNSNIGELNAFIEYVGSSARESNCKELLEAINSCIKDCYKIVEAHDQDSSIDKMRFCYDWIRKLEHKLGARIFTQNDKRISDGYIKLADCPQQAHTCNTMESQEAVNSISRKIDFDQAICKTTIATQTKRVTCYNKATVTNYEERETIQSGKWKEEIQKQTKKLNEYSLRLKEKQCDDEWVVTIANVMRVEQDFALQSSKIKKRKRN